MNLPTSPYDCFLNLQVQRDGFPTAKALLYPVFREFEIVTRFTDVSQKLSMMPNTLCTYYKFFCQPSGRQNVVLMVVVAVAAKRIPLDKPEILLWLRGIFFASNIGVLGCCLVIHRKIRRNGDHSTAQHTFSVTDILPADTTSLSYTGQQAQETSPNKEVTVYAHDKKFLSTLYRLPLRGLLMVAFMHFYMKSTKPLILQSILPLKALWEADIFRVHIRGHAASGELQRPWRSRKGPRQLLSEYLGFAVRIWKGKPIKGKNA